ncbi:MAG TPA: CapA family protein [Spirochaetota bacterium]|nr:CapA family protein [Spirochaetota bacterium]
MLPAIKRTVLSVFFIIAAIISGCDGNIDAPDDNPAEPGFWSLGGDVEAGSAGISGVKMSISRGGTDVAIVLTGAQGQYRAENLAPDTYTVRPSKQGFTFSPESIEVIVSSADRNNIDFAATADPEPLWALGGSVTCGGDGLMGVSVSISLDDSVVAVAQTGADGRYQANNLAEGTYTVVPLKEGYTFKPESIEVAISGADSDDNGFIATADPGTVDPPVDPDLRALGGAVTFGGIGLPGVSLMITLNDSVAAVVLTDEDGVYRADNLEEGAYIVTPSKEGYTFDPGFWNVNLSGADNLNIDFTAAADPEPVWSLGGTITCGGEALSGVSVSLSLDGSIASIALTGADGRYEADNLYNGTYTVAPSGEGYTFNPVSRSVHISGSDRDDIDFTAAADPEPVWSLGGTITSGGAALSGVSVSVSLGGDLVASVQTDSQGEYRAENLAAGTYTVTPSRSGYEFTPSSLTVTISGSDSEDNGFTAAAVSGGGAVKLIFVGDINYAHFVEEVIQDPAIGNGDYRYPLLQVADYLKSADITFGNLESMISDQGEDTKDWLTELGYGLSLRAAPGSIDGLQYAGFDILNLANNHTGDFDFEAMEDCVSRLDAAGIDHVGVGENYAAAHAPVIREVNGTRIAFLGYSNVPMYADVTGTTKSCKWIARGEETGEDDRWGLAWASDYRFAKYGDFSDMQNDIRNARAQADIVIVSAHFGWEYAQKPDTNEDGKTPLTEQKEKAQQEMAHLAIDAGASLVVGHHPHVVQWLDDAKTTAIESYNGGYIAYSLGNFLFDISSERDETAPHGLLMNVTVKNGAIDSIEQVKTHYHDDYWQAHFDE